MILETWYSISAIHGLHCVKSVQIQNFSGPHFLAFIRTEYGKYGPERTSYLHTYHAVLKKALPHSIQSKNHIHGLFWQRFQITLTWWRGLSNQEAWPSASTRRARRSDATMLDKDKQIFFMLMPRTWFKVEEFRLE